MDSLLGREDSAKSLTAVNAVQAPRASLPAVATAVVERGGMDEFVVHMTSLAALELERYGGSECEKWAEGCSVHRAEVGTTSAEAEAGRSRVHRPMDIRARTSRTIDPRHGATSPRAPPLAWDRGLELLAAGTRVARQLKQAVLEATGLTASVGVANSKILVKYSGGVHAPVRCDGVISNAPR